jgi:antitoxin component YwqK of YwqJK toxin-antitoxin module
MQGKLSLVVLVWIVSLGAVGQVFHLKLNQLDKQGRRQGHWITWQDSVRRLPSSKSWFRDGKEYRTTRYYHSNGKTRLKLRYHGDSLIRVKYYDTLGHVTHKGRALRLYTPTEIRYCWDGKWKYYDGRRKYIKAVIYRKGENISEPDE